MSTSYCPIQSAPPSLAHTPRCVVFFSDLPQAIEKLDPAKLVPFPQFDGSRFRELLDEEMGYVDVDHDHKSKNGARR